MKGKSLYVIAEKDLVFIMMANVPGAKFTMPQMLIRDYVIPAEEGIGPSQDSHHTKANSRAKNRI
jgi:hypothetical protein